MHLKFLDLRLTFATLPDGSERALFYVRNELKIRN